MELAGTHLWLVTVVTTEVVVILHVHAGLIDEEVVYFLFPFEIAGAYSSFLLITVGNHQLYLRTTPRPLSGKASKARCTPLTHLL